MQQHSLSWGCHALHGPLAMPLGALEHYIRAAEMQTCKIVHCAGNCMTPPPIKLFIMAKDVCNSAYQDVLQHTTNKHSRKSEQCFLRDSAFRSRVQTIGCIAECDALLGSNIQTQRMYSFAADAARTSGSLINIEDPYSGPGLGHFCSCTFCITLNCWLQLCQGHYLEPFSRSWGCCMTVTPLRCAPELAVMDSC